MRHQHSEENDAYDADTNDDDNINDSKDIFKENITNLSKRYDVMLKRTKRNHSLFEQYKCMHCVKLFPTQDPLDNNFLGYKKEQRRIWHSVLAIILNHPFKML